MDFREKTAAQKAEEYRMMKEDIRILDLVQEYGYTRVRKGRYYSMVEHDSVMIDPVKNFFYRNSNDMGGSSIDFAMEFGPYDSDLHSVLKDFSARVGISGKKENPKPVSPKPVSPVKSIQEPEKKEVGDIVLPQRDTNVKNAYAYLVSTRGIDKSIVADFIAKHKLYQDTRKNCVFVNYDKDKKPTFANLRGTNQYARFIADVPGSDYNRCFYVDNNSTSIVVTESVIDAMSVMTFKRHNGFTENKDNYLALSSANKYRALMTHIKDHPEINEVKMMLDNDTSGTLFTEKSKTMLEESGWQGTFVSEQPFFTKDWNDELKYCQSNNIRYDYHAPSKEGLELLENYCNAKFECYSNGADPRLYTNARKQKEAVIEKVAESDLPQKILDYAENYYDNADVLERYPHDGEETAQIIIDHYNHKNNDFSDVIQLKEKKQATYIDQISKASRDVARDQNNDIEVGE